MQINGTSRLFSFLRSMKSFNQKTSYVPTEFFLLQYSVKLSIGKQNLKNTVLAVSVYWSRTFIIATIPILQLSTKEKPKFHGVTAAALKCVSRESIQKVNRFVYGLDKA